MENPWLQLPASPPFVLPADHPRIEDFNKRLRPSQAKCRLDLSLYPAPWMGNPQAPLVVLSRNPSISAGDREAHQNRDYIAALRANVQDDPAGQAVVGLLERFRHTPTGVYWRPRFKDLIEHVGSSDELASRVLIVEFHGYRSEGEYRPITLPSQAYGSSSCGPQCGDTRRSSSWWGTVFGAMPSRSFARTQTCYRCAAPSVHTSRRGTWVPKASNASSRRWTEPLPFSSASPRGDAHVRRRPSPTARTAPLASTRL